MIRNIFTVGGWTLVSRVTGFVRDIVMAAILGAGPIADAFLVAFRLPNHFRAIFAEGAFAAAFVPAYARRLQQDGSEEARRFADEIATGLLIVLGCLLALALIFTPAAVRVLAPGLSADPAAAGGVLFAATRRVLLAGGAAASHGFGLRPRWPRLDPPTRQFLKALGPAIVGAGGGAPALLARQGVPPLPAGGRSLRALLCRPHHPAADRRRGDCRRHRAVAGDVAAARR